MNNYQNNNFISNCHIFKMEKLVRDKIPQILEAQGAKVFHRIMDENEYYKYLKLKIIEEANEVLTAKSRNEVIEELSDLIEVIKNIQSLHAIENEELENARIAKKSSNGGFQNRVYIAKVLIPKGHKLAGYYLARSENYPEEQSS